MPKRKRPYIELRENEDFGEAACGCILERRENDTHAYLICAKHEAAQELIDACIHAQAQLGEYVREYNLPEDIEAYGALKAAISKAEGRP